MSEWIATSERMPNEGKSVLIVSPARHAFKIRLATLRLTTDTGDISDSEYWWDYEEDGCNLDEITHWLPIPPLPASKEVTNG